MHGERCKNSVNYAAGRRVGSAAVCPSRAVLDDLYFERKMRLLSACLPFYDGLAVPVNV